MQKTPPEERWLQTSKIRMCYLDWGVSQGSSEQRSETAVLALHGLASSCHWYDLVIPHLADTYRCIAPDQRGHGQTDQPPTGYDWQTLTTDVVEALDQLGIERVAVIGHSWGGYVALSLATKYPERVSNLVMVDGGFFDWTRWPGVTWEIYKDRLKPRNVLGTRDDFLNHLRQQLAECWSDQLEGMVMSMVHVEPDGTLRDILEPTNHAQVLEAMWNEPCSTMFPQVRCPTLIVAAEPSESSRNSEFAQLRRDMAIVAQSAIADCHVEWIPNSSHDVGYHTPVELAGAVRTFLSRR